jgi:phosphate transport system permease protein
MAGIPSVVLGFIGIQALSPFLRTFLNLPTGLTALSGAILLALIAIPSIVSIAEDALYAVPNSYRDASYALGATQWQTIWGVVMPSARSGLMTAVMLGIGRSLGETMAVMMVTGNATTSFAGLKSTSCRAHHDRTSPRRWRVCQQQRTLHVLFFIGIILSFFVD